MSASKTQETVGKLRRSVSRYADEGNSTEKENCMKGYSQMNIDHVGGGNYHVLQLGM